MVQGGAKGPDRGRLLVVDDDPEVCNLLSMVLSKDGFQVDTCGTVEEAGKALAEEFHDLVILDVSLGSGDGRDLLTSIRQTSDLPVIMLSGRGHEADRLSGLTMGADDYVVKPFSPRELAVRVGNVLRRARPSAPTVLESGRMRIDLAVRELSIDGSIIELTAKEFDLLAFLAGSPRQVFSRAQLLESVWASNSDWQDEATVTEHVRRVRRKIEDDPDQPCWITTIRGVGYRFDP